MLAAAGWPDSRKAVVIVGHQPALGEAAALLMAGEASEWWMQKGAIWWLANRERARSGSHAESGDRRRFRLGLERRVGTWCGGWTGRNGYPSARHSLASFCSRWPVNGCARASARERRSGLAPHRQRKTRRRNRATRVVEQDRQAQRTKLRAKFDVAEHRVDLGESAAATEHEP